jgi:AraC-like DNA-binding protein
MLSILRDWETGQQKVNEESGFVNFSGVYQIDMTYADYYSAIGQPDEADRYFDRIESYIHALPTGNKASYLYRRFMSYCYSDRNKEGLAIADTLYRLFIERNNTQGALSVLEFKAWMLGKTGRGSEAVELYDKVIYQKDSIHRLDIATQLNDLRTRYELDRAELEIERKTEVIRRNRLVNTFLAVTCIGLSVIVGLVVMNRRTVVRKNRGLYDRIKAQDRLAEELEVKSRQYDELSLFLRPAAQADIAQAGGSEGSAGSILQRQLVSRLRDNLLGDRKFLNPDFNRDALIHALTTNKTSLFDAVKAVTGKSLQEYINFLRLEEARRMLENQPNVTIEFIAGACGFNSRRTFHRLFREQYRISPTAYRMAAISKSNNLTV